ncbi:peptide chain release factor N(5)-glutamine methyltransferase [Marivita sp. GX14005]|uniref:peptide chain release factor N(5)-glutamine methyltransferase n=1 Tax=Marivita sp. GX14005 TaxID=2942276 RepID=UPI0020198D32|nr:peptide chain release factor N(5)-glutamine methyltransferase [Marivita sp. GX14005]MCL3883483.1 peptide chain release factor N(5)-glutamine methyltransferase [Marivita sp. GX14005]
MTGAQALSRAVARLKAAAIPDPSRDARRLLAHTLGIAPGRLTLVLPDNMPPGAAERLGALVARRCAREPVSHLTGSRAFYGREFIVTPEVLDPRPETETLIEQALTAPFTRLLDLGTGSGCILCTLLAECPGASGTGTDLSAAALEIALRNAQRLGLAKRVRFEQGAWLEAVSPDDRFDLIVSNPPYIAAAEMPGLAPELAHEPRIALTDEGDGLSAYRIIAAQAVRHLAPRGRLMVEIGPTQGDRVRAFFAQAGLEMIETHTDLDGRNRVVSGVKSPHTLC